MFIVPNQKINKALISKSWKSIYLGRIKCIHLFPLKETKLLLWPFSNLFQDEICSLWKEWKWTDTVDTTNESNILRLLGSNLFIFHTDDFGSKMFYPCPVSLFRDIHQLKNGWREAGVGWGVEMEEKINFQVSVIKIPT